MKTIALLNSMLFAGPILSQTVLQEFPEAGAEWLKVFLSAFGSSDVDVDEYLKVLKHGCWCAKLDVDNQLFPDYYATLGGPHTMDPLGNLSPCDIPLETKSQ